MVSIYKICTYICIYMSPVYVDTGHNPNRSILDSGLEGRPFLIPMFMVEENFLRLNKVSWVRLKWVAMQSQV